MKFTVFAVLVVVLCSVNAAPRDHHDEMCPAEENESSDVVLLPHESDCSKYWTCANGHAIPMNCPDGLLFSPKLRVCDWADYVTCGQSGGTDGETETL